MQKTFIELRFFSICFSSFFFKYYSEALILIVFKNDILIINFFSLSFSINYQFSLSFNNFSSSHCFRNNQNLKRMFVCLLREELDESGGGVGRRRRGIEFINYVFDVIKTWQTFAMLKMPQRKVCPLTEHCLILVSGHKTNTMKFLILHKRTE